MKRNMCSSILKIVTLALCIVSVAAVAEESAKKTAEKQEAKITQKFGGEAFLHWRWNFNHDADLAPSEFDFSRIELKHAMSYKNFEAQAKLEAGRVKEITGVTIDDGEAKVETDKRLKISVKRAFLSYKFLDKKLAVHAGIHDNLRTYALQEKLWGYRYIYKSFLDHYGFAASEGLGMGITAKPAKMLRFDVGLVNGEGRKKQQDSDGRYKTTFSGELKAAGLEVHLYGDVMPKKDGETQSTFSGLLGYRLKKIFRIGAEYNLQSNTKNKLDSDLHGVSVYAAGTIKIMDIFARVDLFSTDTWENNEAVVLGGLSFAPIKYFEISPNIRVKMPADGSADNDVKFYINGKFKF